MMKLLRGLLAIALLIPACAIDADDANDDGDEDEPTAAQTQEITIRNPVKQGCADPSVMKDGATYFMTCTGGDGKGNLFPIFTSTDLLSLTRNGEVFPKNTFPTWADGNWWAPELHRVGNKFVAVFSAKNKSTGKNAIGIAQATSPTGPFVDRGSPIASSAENSAIDAHLMMDGPNNPLLYYKGERVNAKGQGDDIVRVMPLSPDAMSAAGPPTTILGLTEGWEGNIVEAPWVMKRGSFYYLFYSGNLYCNSTYAVGVARSKSPFGPFEKKGAPILKSGKRWVGPGHQAITQGPDGRTWIVYHAYNKASEGTPTCGSSPNDNNKRHALVDRIVFEKDWPRVVSNL